MSPHFSNPIISELSWWYIDFWRPQVTKENMHMQIALQCCRMLQSVLEAVNPSQIDRTDKLAILCKTVHEYFIGYFHPRTLLLGEGDDFMLCDGVLVHVSTILNNLAQSYNVSKIYTLVLIVLSMSMNSDSPFPSCI